MKEITAILKAYHKAKQENLRMALATVVHLEGSSYRRPGARMLVTEDGQLTGAISGGCLEGDALRKALSAIHQQENKLVTYDTTDEDDAKFGVQLGCNGIVHILFEPIDIGKEINPISLLSEIETTREHTVIATLFSLQNKYQPGTSHLLKDGRLIRLNPEINALEIENDLQKVYFDRVSEFKEYRINNENISAFLEFVKPPVSIVIAGAGNDAQPLAEICDLLGWKVTIADGRQTHATTQRFPKAQSVFVTKPAELLSKVEIDEQTAFVLMTHNYNYDMDLLNRLLPSKAAYIGTLGPKKKLIRMLDELGLNTLPNSNRVHGPIGLDIGAETAEEIAISIVAEIKAVLSNTSAGKLKEKNAPIHTSPA